MGCWVVINCIMFLPIHGVTHVRPPTLVAHGFIDPDTSPINLQAKKRGSSASTRAWCESTCEGTIRRDCAHSFQSPKKNACAFGRFRTC